MAKDAVEQYFKELHEIRATGGGSDEVPYYTPLTNLLNALGATLKPKVKCIGGVLDTGAGSPDLGLYSANQFKKSKDNKPIPGQLPERGVIEVKPFKDDTWVRAEGKQVSKYWDRYGQVLVTNYRDFVLVGKDENGKFIRHEDFHFGGNAKEFAAAIAHPRTLADKQGERLTEYLKRVMLYKAKITEPEDLAWFLASYAKEAKARVEAAGELPGLASLRKGLEDALGLKFEGEDGEHFFRATLVQTLFYGVFSAWVLWAGENKNPQAKFKWRDTIWNLHVPMIASLFEQIATPTRLKPLGVDEVLDWTGEVLDRVDRGEFFEKFKEEQAIQYFYEPFLEAYDPDLRTELGVWYTPPEIVKYQVERVDRVLRSELGIADGLADESVYVLDPCCGTGAYLVETLRRIHKTLEEKGASALNAQKLKKAATKRVFGFEILPAPFVISHLQLGVMLRTLGAPLKDDKNERAAVYLTNALTGWEPLKKPKDHLPYPELEEERDAANDVKTSAPILVILGNPPYNAFAGTSPDEEEGLVEVYKEGLNKPVDKGGWGIKKFNLDDLYVRFFRIAERRIVKGGKGVVSFISSFSYLSDPSFVVMRQALLREFDKLWFDCMNGDSRQTGKLTPEGKSDPSVFSTERNKEGIRVGTAVCVMVRKTTRAKMAEVKFRHFWGTKKREELAASVEVKAGASQYAAAKPEKRNRFSFRPGDDAGSYDEWPRASEISCVEAYNGPVERRGNSLIVFEAAELDSLRDYLDARVQDEAIESLVPEFMKSSGEFDARKARMALKGKVIFDRMKIRRYPFKPMDIRVAYLDPEIAPLFSRPSPNLLKQSAIESNWFLMTRDTADKDPEGTPFLFSKLVCDYDCISGHTRHFPAWVLKEKKQKKAKGVQAATMFADDTPQVETIANLSEKARAYLKKLGLQDPDKDKEVASLIWMHSLAVGYSHAYLSENADGIKSDWPRIPLPAKKKDLLASAELGKKIAALLDTENAVEGVTTGKIRPELKAIGVLSMVGGGQLDDGELDVTAGWGHPGKGGVCMPGRGRVVERPCMKEEGTTCCAPTKAASVDAHATTKDHGQDAHATKEKSIHAGGVRYIEEKKAQAGSSSYPEEKTGGHAGPPLQETNDVYLNDKAYYKNVPTAVWEYYIGGYQVVKKWLSYRDKSMLGRGLKMEEADYVTEMIRRIGAIVMMGEELDANYKRVKEDTYEWGKVAE